MAARRARLFTIQFSRHPEEPNVDPNTDDLKGRAKEAVGDLTDNDQLKREGQADRKAGKAKDFIDSAGEKAKDLVDDLKDRVHRSDKK